MERRRFTREFKVEAVQLVRERGVDVVEAALIARDHRAARSYEGLTRINRVRSMWMLHCLLNVATAEN